MATDIPLRRQAIIYQLAADPIKTMKRMEAVAADTKRQHIRVRLPARQLRSVRLTLKVSLGINGGRIVPCLKSEANDQS